MTDERLKRLETVPRLKAEAHTIETMVRLYCHHHHDAESGLCPECSAFLEYALRRLACCPFGAEKPVCGKCRIHCYKPAEREKARAVMRWAGPRLILHHPLMALRHVWDKATRPAPEKPRNRTNRQKES